MCLPIEHQSSNLEYHAKWDPPMDNVDFIGPWSSFDCESSCVVSHYLGKLDPEVVGSIS